MTPPPPDQDESASPPGPAEIVEVVPSRQPEGHGFYFKVQASGRLYRLDSARDPQLPRFWCFRIYRCAASGVVDSNERPWFGGDRMTREELPAAVAAIRAAASDWLALPEHGDLRAWVLEDRPVETMHAALLPNRARRVQAS